MQGTSLYFKQKQPLIHVLCQKDSTSRFILVILCNLGHTASLDVYNFLLTTSVLAVAPAPPFFGSSLTEARSSRRLEPAMEFPGQPDLQARVYVSNLPFEASAEVNTACSLLFWEPLL